MLATGLVAVLALLASVAAKVVSGKPSPSSPVAAAERGSPPDGIAPPSEAGAPPSSSESKWGFLVKLLTCAGRSIQGIRPVRACILYLPNLRSLYGNSAGIAIKFETSVPLRHRIGS